MPYIEQKDRKRVDKTNEPQTVGELNYLVSRLCNAFLGTDPSYEDFNAVIGMLQCASLELYRRRIAPYETLKMVENGDVYI